MANQSPEFLLPSRLLRHFERLDGPTTITDLDHRSIELADHTQYDWIGKNKAAWPVTLTCEVLGVSTSGYFEHQRRSRVSRPSKPGGGQLNNEALCAHIRAIYAEVKGEYGWPRVWKELLARGVRVGEARVQRLMHTHGIKARGKRKFVVSNDSKHELPIAENLMARDFTPVAPDRVWSRDITLYLVVVANSFRHSRRGQHGYHVRLRAWDVDVAPRLTFAPFRDRTVAKASPSAMSLH